LVWKWKSLRLFARSIKNQNACKVVHTLGSLGGRNTPSRLDLQLTAPHTVCSAAPHFTCDLGGRGMWCLTEHVLMLDEFWSNSKSHWPIRFHTKTHTCVCQCKHVTLYCRRSPQTFP
jgi:hypothetical protein